MTTKEKNDTGLCFRCEHRARFLELGFAPRCECGAIEQAVCSCYMYKPVLPVLLRPNEGDRRPISGMPTMLSGRAHRVPLPLAYWGCKDQWVTAPDGKRASLRSPVYGLEHNYPRLAQLKVQLTPDGWVSSRELRAGLRRGKLKKAVFDKYFGIQTCPEGGVYPWDAEAVLERMMSGRLTGTQALWD